MFFLSAVIARTQRQSYIELLGRYLYATALPLLVMASLVITLVVLWSSSPWISIVVIGPLITVALHERWLHRALERLREFDRLKDEFIAVISHELRTPLTSVYGAALTLQKQDIDDEMRDTLLDIVSDEAGRLARLLDRALSASRLDANRETFDIDSLDGVSVARTVVDAARQRLPPRLELALAFDADVPRVLADADKLRQILVNLTENAIKYSPDGGHIDVRVARAGDEGAVQRARSGHRHPARRAGAHLRALPPARPEHDARRRRPRARALHLPPARGAHARAHLGDVAGGRRLDLRVRAARRARQRCLGKPPMRGMGGTPE